MKRKIQTGIFRKSFFFAVENKGLRAHSNFVIVYFAPGDSYASIGPCTTEKVEKDKRSFEAEFFQDKIFKA